MRNPQKAKMSLPQLAQILFRTCFFAHFGTPKQLLVAQTIVA